MTLRNVWLLLFVVLVATPTLARDILMDDPINDGEYDVPDRPDWLEGEVQVPESINSDDLQEFQVAANESRFRYFVERNSIQHDSDGAVRFTLVIRSSSGAANSSYEGFRCRERLYKVYAYGGSDRLTPMPGGDWERVPKDESTDYRATLYDDLLCNLQIGEPNPVEKVFEAMRNNRKVGRD
ncbi:MAG: CNP1-like family protein [Candidatus Thiodiazotropha endolucinida]|uniref:CNP1-like family protein n=1 Tax=Candidatus Thiodiazotropha taylori TaxID=2792791 RepID=A0A9E4NPV5_9GAMM|nr:CNP1-like family protein [Candidatus Thiodiazotropha taylori]MCW4238939.1 CNP1-like family protein [Candidatus Thiodiazotropha endolucinida]